MRKNECSMKGCGGCGWFHKTKKLRKSRSYRHSLSWLSNFLFRKYHTLWRIIYGQTERVCDYHYLLANFGLAETRLEGKECFCRIELLFKDELEEENNEDNSIEFLT